MKKLQGKIEVPDLRALQNIAEDLAVELRPGDAVLLDGELGAGKTTFTQLLARALGAQAPVQSPTFTIEARYALPHPQIHEMIHLDLYRLPTAEASGTDALYLKELFQEASHSHQLIVVEWAERLDKQLLMHGWRIHLAHPSSDKPRIVTITRHG